MGPIEDGAAREQLLFARWFAGVIGPSSLMEPWGAIGNGLLSGSTIDRANSEQMQCGELLRPGSDTPPSRPEHYQFRRHLWPSHSDFMVTDGAVRGEVEPQAMLLKSERPARAG